MSKITHSLIDSDLGITSSCSGVRSFDISASLVTWIWTERLRIAGSSTIFLSSAKCPDQLQGPSRLPGVKQLTAILYLVLRF